MASPKMSLKLLVDKKGQRVLFAEATKEFVDFLFHIFSLPLGTLIEFLGSKQMVGSLGKLKESVEVFDETYLQPGIHKHEIFNPRKALNGNIFLLSYDASADDQSGARTTIYVCPGTSGYGFDCRPYATLYADARCPSCEKLMHVALKTVEGKKKVAAPKNSKTKGGYVKEVVTYMVMDDLVVKPMSTISSITLLTKFDVKDLSQLEEKIVSFGQDEALKLLQASLSTEKVLTTVFLQKKKV